MKVHDELLFRKVAKMALEDGTLTKEQYERIIYELDLKKMIQEAEIDKQINKAKQDFFRRSDFALT